MVGNIRYIVYFVIALTALAIGVSAVSRLFIKADLPFDYGSSRHESFVESDFGELKSGDLINAVNDIPVESAFEIETLIDNKLPGDVIRVVDNGRGIPTDIHPKTKVSALETIMCTLHAGGKFGGDGYAGATGGLHGVGASVVNALSIMWKVEVHHDGGVFMQEYKQGVRKAAVKQIGKSKLHGTIVTFKPDAEIFKDGTTFAWDRIVSHLRQQAYLVRGIKIHVIDARR